jgi:hypothetical protein
MMPDNDTPGGGVFLFGAAGSIPVDSFKLRIGYLLKSP